MLIVLWAKELLLKSSLVYKFAFDLRSPMVKVGSMVK